MTFDEWWEETYEDSYKHSKCYNAIKDVARQAWTDSKEYHDGTN